MYVRLSVWTCVCLPTYKSESSLDLGIHYYFPVCRLYLHVLIAKQTHPVKVEL